MKKKVIDVNKVLKSLDKKKKLSSKYVIDYEVDEKNLLVYSSNGKSKVIKKTHSNMNKLNRIILNNKVLIQRKLDDYSDTKSARLFILILSIMLVCFSGLFVILSFFTGVISLLVASCASFSLTVLITSLNGIKYYMIARDVQKINNLVDHSSDSEYSIPKINLKVLKRN